MTAYMTTQLITAHMLTHKTLKTPKTLKPPKTPETHLKKLMCLCAAVYEFHLLVGHANDCCFTVVGSVFECCARRLCLSLSLSLPLFLGHRHRDRRHRHRHRHGLVVEIDHGAHDCVHDYTIDYSAHAYT